MRTKQKFLERISQRLKQRPKRTFMSFFLVVAVLGCFSILFSPIEVASKSDNGDFVRLEGVIQLPSASISAAWSPDSKKLLVSLPYGIPNSFPVGQIKSATLLVDVATKSVTDLNAPLDNVLDDIFWSPDGRFIATARGSHILLYEYPGLREIARLDSEPPSSETWCSFKTKEGLQFTRDSRFLWVACNIHSVRPAGRFLLATKLSVPGLKVADRLFIPNPEPTKRVSDRQYVSRQGDKIVLNSVLQMHGDKLFSGFQYVACFLLEAKKPCYRPFQIKELNIGSDVKHAPAFSVARQLGAVTVMGPIQKVESRTVIRRHQLKLFSETIKKPISTIAPGAHSTVTSIGSPVFLKGGRFLFASAVPKDKDHNSHLSSGFGVWRVNGLNSDLELVQLIVSPMHSARFLSPDSSQLAIINGRKLHLYSFSESVLGTGDQP